MPTSTLDNTEYEILQMIKALKEAYTHALKEGFDVLESKDGNLVRTHPDGSYTIIKPLPPKRKVKIGQVAHLRA